MLEEVIINGAAKEIGGAAVIAVTKARGMEVAGAVDSYLVGEDIGNVSDSLTSPFRFLFFILLKIVSVNYIPSELGNSNRFVTWKSHLKYP